MKWYLFLCLWFSPCIFLSAQSIEQLHILKPGQFLKVDFTQKKSITGIPKPLISTGQMLLWEGKGVLWNIQTPFPNSILISPKGIFEIENDQKIPLMKSDQSQIGDLLAKVLMGDFTGLELFQMEELPAEQGSWKKRLIPKNETFRNFLQAIEVRGSTHVLAVILQRPNNDRDEIFFDHHLILDPNAIDQVFTSQQKALFD